MASELIAPPDRSSSPADHPVWTAEELVRHFGPISLDRLSRHPVPGSGTEQDLLEFEGRTERRLYELYDGLLLEKGMGSYESFVAVKLCTILWNFISPRKLGVVLGESSLIRFLPGKILIPDVAFLSRERLPASGFPREPIIDLVPDLAVEILSRSNTSREMATKRGLYFQAGVTEIWEIDPRAETLTVYRADHPQLIHSRDAQIESSTLFPGLPFSLAELFDGTELPPTD